MTQINNVSIFNDLTTPGISKTQAKSTESCEIIELVLKNYDNFKVLGKKIKRFEIHLMKYIFNARRKEKNYNVSR